MSKKCRILGLVVLSILMLVVITLPIRKSASVATTVATATAPATVATTVAPATASATVAPALVATTVAPATAVTATEVTSSEVSKAAIQQDTDGKLRTKMILESDLSKISYTEIEISVWNGIYILANSEGIVGELFGREYAKADSQLRAGQREERVVKTFFVDGKVLRSNAREGFAIANTTVGFYPNLTNVKFVKLEGENHYRLVVVGKATNKGGSSKTTTAKPAPTATPRIPEEAATPRIPDATMPPEVVATPRIPDMDMPTEDSATAAPSISDEVALPTIGGDDVAEPSIGGEDSSETDWDI